MIRRRFIQGLLITLILVFPITAPGGTSSFTSPLIVVPFEQAETRVSPDGLAHIRLLLGPSAHHTPPNIHVGYMTLAPGAHVKPHTHATSEEVLILLHGKGQLKVGSDIVKLRSPAAIVIPRGLEHEFTTSGEKPVEAVQMYIPAGPEGKFLYWPKTEKQPSSRQRESL